MMKTSASLLLSAAALALIAAPAMADPIVASSFSANNASSILITGDSSWDAGMAENRDGATFTLKGAVSTDCAYYIGNVSTTLDFGAIGINASNDVGLSNAFDMAAPASVTIDTSVAGCNTQNTVSVLKDNILGLVNTSDAGYDANTFQANLPYSVKATYTAGQVGAKDAATLGDYITLGVDEDYALAQHGAWKSDMVLTVNIPVPSKSLLAGAYEGQMTVNIQAF